MRRTLSKVTEHARSTEGRKQLRYLGVSLVFVPVGQVLIQLIGYFLLDRNYTLASIVSAAILTFPNFFANKRFVWRDATSDRLRTQVTVFWVAAMLGVTLATLLTFWVEHLTKGSSAAIEALAVFVAQLTGFGVVWVGRYLVLDRWLFKVTHHGEEPSVEDIQSLHGDIPI